MADTSMIEPLAPAEVAPTAPAAAPPPSEPEEAAETQLPEELLAIPAVQAVFAGTPPAVSMKIANAGQRPEVKAIAENKDALLGAGMAFYRSLSGELGVMFNILKLNPEDLKAADKRGVLRQIAPDFDLVNHEVSKLGTQHPAFSAGEPGAAVPPAMSVGAPQAASGQLSLSPPPPASVQRRLAQERLKNLTLGAPSTGPAPGAGRLLNSVLKPVV